MPHKNTIASILKTGALWKTEVLTFILVHYPRDVVVFQIFQTKEMAYVCSAAFSSLHEMLRMSYCDRSVSVLQCKLSVINFIPCVRSRDHIFSPTLIKLGQNVCLDKSWMSLKIGDVGSKSRSLGQI